MKRAIILSNGTQVLGAVTFGENGNVKQDKQTIDKTETNNTISLSNGTQVLGAVALGENGNGLQDKQTIDKREAN